MPYKSAKQRAYMHIHEPEIAARWDREYGGKINPGGKKMPDQRAMFKRALNRMKTSKQGNIPGRAVGRNPTPGIPRRVGPPDRIHPASSNNKPPLSSSRPVGNMTGPGATPGIAVGERPPSGTIPSMEKPPRQEAPTETLGMRRLNRLSDKRTGNDKRGLEVAMRLFGRAQAGKGFGYKAFGQRVGGGKKSEDSVADFFSTMKPYLKGTGYNRMFRQAAGLPVKSRKKPTNYPGPGTGPWTK